jgi:hypothetical protein
MGYALKVAAMFNFGSGVFNHLMDSDSWAMGNFLFALVLFLCGIWASEHFGKLGPLQTVRVKKKPWHPYDNE